MRREGGGVTLRLAVGVIVVGVVALIGGRGPDTPGPADATAPARISPAEAAAVAVNDLRRAGSGFVLHHPSYDADFTRSGIVFTPRGSGAEWRWRLRYVGSATEPLLDPARPVRPNQVGKRTIAYARGPIVEQYVLRGDAIEQQFVLPRRLPALDSDLVITGAVSARGSFGRNAKGWRWRTGRSEVTLGTETVRDARGRVLPSRMRVTAREVRLTVSAAALARAAYPVTVDPEIGVSDFPVSQMGQPPEQFDGFNPAVAYSPWQGAYLVVWQGDDGPPATADDEFEIFAAYVDAAGSYISSGHPVSDMGPADDPNFDALDPAVTYNPVAKEFLVVWSGDDTTDGEFEIFGQRLATNGLELGTNDFRISDMGVDGNSNSDAERPSAAYNPATGEYLVAWSGADTTPGEFEIYAQRLTDSGVETGANDLRISAMGPAANASFDALSPALAASGATGEYLVVWQGDDDTAPNVDDEFEIFGQRLNAATGAEVGTDDFRISEMGPHSSAAFAAVEPAAAYNAATGEYLVVWSGDHNTGGLADNEFEIFGQRLTATGVEAGQNDFRISDLGTDRDPAFAAHAPALSWNGTTSEYLVVWSGDDGIDGELEIFGQRLTSAGAEAGANDFRVSDAGPEGVRDFAAEAPAVAYNEANEEYTVVWHADDKDIDDIELHGQRLDAATAAELGANDFRISDMVRDDNASFQAGGGPAVVYNPTDNEYMVVWSGTDDRAGLTADEYEIYGQRISAATGVEVGADDFRISDMGPDGGADYDAFDPAVAYNSVDREYLVVWSADDDAIGLAQDEREIWGQRLTPTGSEVGGNDFRISEMGPEGDPGWFGAEPAVAYNSTNNEYVVVWLGTDDRPGMVYQQEIYGQRLTGGTGAPIGIDDFRVSDAGPDDDYSWSVSSPVIAYNGAANEYLTVWSGDDDVTAEVEIHGQRLAGLDAAEVGTNDFRISNTGPSGNYSYAAYLPSIAWNARGDQYLVVWEAWLFTDQEIFGRRLSGAGAAIGADFQISEMGPSGNNSFRGGDPAASWNSATGEFLVVWYGHDSTPSGQLHGIFGQRLTEAGTETGADDFFISERANGQFPAATHATDTREDFVAWYARRNGVPPPAEGPQIFGQRLSSGTPTGVLARQFKARRVQRTVVLSWRTASESGLAGFIVSRTDGPGSRGRRVGPPLIAARTGAATRGAVYRLVDRWPLRVPRPTYRLEALRLDGSRTVVATTRLAGDR